MKRVYLWENHVLNFSTKKWQRSRESGVGPLENQGVWVEPFENQGAGVEPFENQGAGVGLFENQEVRVTVFCCFFFIRLRTPADHSFTKNPVSFQGCYWLILLKLGINIQFCLVNKDFLLNFPWMASPPQLELGSSMKHPPRVSVASGVCGQLPPSQEPPQPLGWLG